jgi:hypothetical protein
MADDEQAPAPTQDVAPPEHAPANEPVPAEPPLPELDLELQLRGGQDAAPMETTLVESKDVETKDS